MLANEDAALRTRLQAWRDRQTEAARAMTLPPWRFFSRGVAPVGRRASLAETSVTVSPAGAAVVKIGTGRSAGDHLPFRRP